VLRVDRKQRVGQQQQSRGILFCEFFSFSLFSQRANSFRLVEIARRPTSRSEEAGDKTCALWCCPVATRMPALQRSTLVVLHDVSLSNNSLGEFFFGKLFFPFLVLAQSERVSFGADCASTDMQIRRSR
jgi:hypothetical protein